MTFTSMPAIPHSVAIGKRGKGESADDAIVPAAVLLHREIKLPHTSHATHATALSSGIARRNRYSPSVLPVACSASLPALSSVIAALNASSENSALVRSSSRGARRKR
jgi:hypothetical protein